MNSIGATGHKNVRSHCSSVRDLWVQQQCRCRFHSGGAYHLQLNIGVSVEQELDDSIYRVVHNALYIPVHMVESTINLALPTFHFPFCLYENCCTSCSLSRGKPVLFYPLFTDFYLMWLTLWLVVCWNTTYSGVSSPNPALNCHRLRTVLQIPVVQ
jgi:hypothetical protein